MRKGIIFVLLLVTIKVFSQQDSVATGQVVDASIVIEKNKEIKLPTAEKLNNEEKPTTFTTDSLNLSYNIREPELSWPAYKSDVGYVPFSGEYEIPAYQNYVKAGFGNYRSPLLELGIFPQLNNWKLRSVLSYESYASGPVNDENSASSFGGLDVSGSYKGDFLNITPQFSYNRMGYRFYGNADRVVSGFNQENPNDVSIDQVQLGTKLEGIGNSYSYFLKPGILSSNQAISGSDRINNEFEFYLEGGLKLDIDTVLNAGFELEAHSSQYDGVTTYNRSLFNLNPWISYRKNAYYLKAGLVVSSDKSIGGSNSSNVYPSIHGEWNASNQWTIFGSISGGKQWNSLVSLLNENRFLDDSLTLLNNDLRSSIQGGIRGNVSSNLQLTLGLKLDSYRDLPFYIPSASDSSRFTLTYDNGNVNVFTFYTKAQLAIGDKTHISGEMEFYGYSLDSLSKAWHKPTYSLTLNGAHQINDRFQLSAEIFSQRGITAPIRINTESITLRSFTDVSFRTTYVVTDRASIFLDLKNLLNQEYEKYIGYPVRGLTFKIGGTYRF